VHYQLTGKGSVGGVEFDLDGPASQVVVGFDNASNHTFNCYSVSGFHWLCEVNGVEVAQINALRVIAVN
jgi:hypothetical protein